VSKLGRPKLEGSGVSREAIRQQQQRALRKARRFLREKGYKAEDFFIIFNKTENPNKC
jgi:hypothetical protein